MSFLTNLTQRLRQALPAPASDTALQAQAQAVVTRLQTDLPELLVAAVVNIQTGRSLTNFVADPARPTAEAHQLNAAAVRQKLDAIAALQLPGETLNEILVTLNSELHLLRVLPEGTHFAYLAVERASTNLALAQRVLQEAVLG